MNKGKPSSYIVSLTVNESLATVLAALLDDWNLGLHWQRNESAAMARLDVYCMSRREANARCKILKSWLARAPAGQATDLAIRPVAAEHWAESWKKHFHVRRVSDRIIIRPPWETYSPAPGEVVIVMDPGMSFGTGEHETTQACLRFLDELQRLGPGGSVLDIGCGTGILAIAAAKLGISRVTAVDNDPAAIRTTRANAALNGVTDRIHCLVADIQTWSPDAPADIVLANLLAGLLIESADRVSAAVAAGPDGCLVLSGILTAQYAEVKAAYARRGLRETRTLVLNDWTTGCFQRTGKSG